MENTNPIIESLVEPMAIGDVFAQSGMFPDVKTQSQAAVKILAGKELGLLPFESMASIYMVNGKLALTSKAMASLIIRSGRYSYEIKEHTAEVCKIVFYRKSEEGPHSEIGVSEYSTKDAAKAGIVNKDSWKNYPMNMLFARALSNGCRWFCPDVVSGYYTTEELDEVVDVKPTKTVEINAEGAVE